MNILEIVYEDTDWVSTLMSAHLPSDKLKSIHEMLLEHDGQKALLFEYYMLADSARRDAILSSLRTKKHGKTKRKYKWGMFMKGVSDPIFQFNKREELTGFLNDKAPTLNDNMNDNMRDKYFVVQLHSSYNILASKKSKIDYQPLHKFLGIRRKPAVKTRKPEVCQISAEMAL